MNTNRLRNFCLACVLLLNTGTDATATATGAIVAGGLRLGALASAHLAAGEIDLEVSAGAALLIAEGR